MSENTATTVCSPHAIAHALAAMDGGVTTALGGVLQSKTPQHKINMDVDFVPTPKLKIIMDDDFKLPPPQQEPCQVRPNL